MTRIVPSGSVEGKLAISGLKSFMAEDLIIDPVLCTPARFVWDAYLKSCKTWGFPAIDGPQFLDMISEVNGIYVRTGGHGRIKRMISGVCLKPAHHS